MTWTVLDDRKHALARLKGCVEIAGPLLDQEERDHLSEIIRLIDENVPAHHFKGLGDFRAKPA